MYVSVEVIWLSKFVYVTELQLELTPTQKNAEQKRKAEEKIVISIEKIYYSRLMNWTVHDLRLIKLRFYPTFRPVGFSCRKE